MEAVVKFSIQQATDDAVVLWAMASSQYTDHSIVLDRIAFKFIKKVSSFALNARRVTESLDDRPKIPLVQARWRWQPTKQMDLVDDLVDALHRIIHAKKLQVGLEPLPDDESVIDTGAFVVPYVLAETDRRHLAYIDPFALSHAYLYGLLPMVSQ